MQVEGEIVSQGITMSRKQQYRNYLKSARWKQLRADRLTYDKYECVLCGGQATGVYHKRYPRILGEETINDLISLCEDCHGIFHKSGKRILKNKRKKNPLLSQYLKLGKFGTFCRRKERGICPKCLNPYTRCYKNGITHEILCIECAFKQAKITKNAKTRKPSKKKLKGPMNQEEKYIWKHLGGYSSFFNPEEVGRQP